MAWLVVALMLVALLGFMAAGVAAVVLLVRRSGARAGELRSAWAALASAQGLVLAPGSAFHDPVLSGTFGGCPVSLTVSRYRLTPNGLSYDYTAARAPARTPGQALVAERARVHHVAGVEGPEVAVVAPGLAATHVARAFPTALAASLLDPGVAARLVQNGVSHLRLGDGELLVQRPGHQVDAGACLGLMQLAADLALRF